MSPIFLQHIPSTKLTNSFLPPDWTYSAGYEPFRKVGTDTFFTISSGLPVLWTTDPEVITQITSRRLDFIKPIKVYGILNVYGVNVVSTEGTQWRQHRKVVAPLFTEQSHELAWAKSLKVSQEMLRGWVGDRGEGIVHDMARDTMSLALRVISWAGFGVRLRWSPKEFSQQDKAIRSEKEHQEDDIPAGHAFSYQEALEQLLHNILSVMLVPPALLSKY